MPKVKEAEKKEKKPTEKKEPVFSVKVVSSGVEYEAEGDELYELLRDFPTPGRINTETNVIVTKGGKTIQRDMKVSDARRCFAGYDTTSLELLAISIGKQLP